MGSPPSVGVRDAPMAGDQPESERPAEDNSDDALATDSIEDERELIADLRDRAADDRDRRADSRDSAADLRDSAADRREPDVPAEQATSAAGPRRDQAGVRDDASRQRETAAEQRVVADRLRAAQDEQRQVSGEVEARAVAAHSVLNRSASVVMGIDTLRDRWQKMDHKDRTVLMGVLRRNARLVHDALGRMIRGQRP
ncbi:MAG: hypothetical protein ACT452_19365 [Microthrixaceae bacterium]